MKAFDKLPEEFQNDEVRQYYDILSKKQASVIFKRAFDLFVSVILLVVNAESLGTMVTTDSDSRVTRIGRKLRKYRLDELPQVFNVLSGSMTVVGTRPEVPKYVDMYEDKYYATLLLPAGITSLASIMYKDEEKLLASTEDADKVYVETILPEKMKYNLEYTEHFSFGSDVKLMFKTVKEVFS